MVESLFSPALSSASSMGSNEYHNRKVAVPYCRRFITTGWVCLAGFGRVGATWRDGFCVVAPAPAGWRMIELMEIRMTVDSREKMRLPVLDVPGISISEDRKLWTSSKGNPQ
eukprot:3895034-Pyramimonas_sp.AAC.1